MYTFSESIGYFLFSDTFNIEKVKYNIRGGHALLAFLLSALCVITAFLVLSDAAIDNGSFGLLVLLGTGVSGCLLLFCSCIWHTAGKMVSAYHAGPATLLKGVCFACTPLITLSVIAFFLRLLPPVFAWTVFAAVCAWSGWLQVKIIRSVFSVTTGKGILLYVTPVVFLIVSKIILGLLFISFLISLMI